MIALFDADILVFRAGFAAERNSWLLRIGEGEAETFRTKKEAMARLDEKLPGIYSRVEGQDFQLWSERYCEPVENALHNVKTMVARSLEALSLSDFDTKFYLSGPRNFRHDLATTLPYKGNRDKAHRPTHEEAIRDYIKSKWETVVTADIEADDALGIAQTKIGPHESVIVSIDKDLEMIPGWKYNFVQDILYDVPKDVAWKTFCLQLLTGDSTDNIPGLKGIGAKKAAAMLDGLPQKEWLPEVARQYACRSGKEDWFGYLKEQAYLIWILQEPPHVPAVERMLKGLDTLGGDEDGSEPISMFD